MRTTVGQLFEILQVGQVLRKMNHPLNTGNSEHHDQVEGQAEDDGSAHKLGTDRESRERKQVSGVRGRKL